MPTPGNMYLTAPGAYWRAWMRLLAASVAPLVGCAAAGNWINEKRWRALRGHHQEQRSWLQEDQTFGPKCRDTVLL